MKNSSLNADKKRLHLPRRIGILGIEGKYGKWFKHHFESQGFEVIGADVNTLVNNQEVIVNSDVVVVCVSMRDAASVIAQNAQYAKKNQLWIDITSLKSDTYASLKTLKSETVQIHPMCAPTVVTLRGQHLIVVQQSPTRLIKWKRWFNNFLLHTEAEIIVEPCHITHDYNRSYDQALAHALILISVMVLSKSEIKGDTIRSGSAFYNIFFTLIGRLLKQNPFLYAEIQMQNKAVKKVLDQVVESAQEFKSVVEAGNTHAFCDIFTLGKQKFSKVELDQSYNFFDEIVALMRK